MNLKRLWIGQVPTPQDEAGSKHQDVTCLSMLYQFYGAGTSEACLYSDAGDGYGESRLEQFRMVRDENGLELTWEQQGDYAFPYRSVQLHLHGFEPQQVWVDGKEVACQGRQLECIGVRQVRFEGISSER